MAEFVISQWELLVENWISIIVISAIFCFVVLLALKAINKNYVKTPNMILDNAKEEADSTSRTASAYRSELDTVNNSLQQKEVQFNNAQKALSNGAFILPFDEKTDEIANEIRDQLEKRMEARGGIKWQNLSQA